jgi:hypothetical protein
VVWQLDPKDRAMLPISTSHGRWRQALLLLLLGVLLVEGYIAVLCRQNDFAWHRRVGQAFLDGAPYAAGCDLYPLARVMMNAGLALVPNLAARIACYVLAVAALLGTMHLWRTRIACHDAEDCRRAGWAWLIASVLVFPFILRDLDECGLQLFLLFFLTAAGTALMQARHALCGFWLATAVSYKSLPILFVPYLLWRRQWRAAGWTTAFTALWAAAPAIYLGPEQTLRCHEEWLSQTLRVARAQEAYPSLLDIEAPKPQNLSLHALVARYLVTVPADHPLHLEHPAFLQFGDLEPAAAFWLVRGAVLGLLLALAWCFHRSRLESNGQHARAREWAVMCILCALLSPICWKQHLVLMLPAVYLSVRAALAEGRWFTWRAAGLGFVGLVVLFSRPFIVGHELAIVLLSYKVDTVAVLVSMGLALRYGPRAPETRQPYPHSIAQERPLAA